MLNNRNGRARARAVQCEQDLPPTSTPTSSYIHATVLLHPRHRPPTSTPPSSYIHATTRTSTSLSTTSSANEDAGVGYTIAFWAGDLVGVGMTSTVARLEAVIKFFGLSRFHFLQREKLVYQRLGRTHPSILRYFGALDNGIILQFASQTSIRQYMARSKQVPRALKLRWVEQLFDAVRFIHSRNVLHGDIPSNNVFLDEILDIKLFGGSASRSSVMKLLMNSLG